MKKEFFEYNIDEDIYLNDIEFYFCSLVHHVKKYIWDGKISIDAKIRDKILIQLINSPIVTTFGKSIIEKDLYDDKDYDNKISACKLLTYLYKDCAYEIFNNENYYSDTEISMDDRTVVLLDFLNYVARINDINKVFTAFDLYDDAKKERLKAHLEETKDFRKIY